MPLVLAISSRRAYKEIMVCSQAGLDSSFPSDPRLRRLDWVRSLFASSLNWKPQYLAPGLWWDGQQHSGVGMELCKWWWPLVMPCALLPRHLQTSGDPGTTGSEIYQQFPSFHTILRLPLFFKEDSRGAGASYSGLSSSVLWHREMP